MRKSLAREATLLEKRGCAKQTQRKSSTARIVRTCTHAIFPTLPFPQENGGRGRCVGAVWCGVLWCGILLAAMQPRFLTAHTPPSLLIRRRRSRDGAARALHSSLLRSCAICAHLGSSGGGCFTHMIVTTV